MEAGTYENDVCNYGSTEQPGCNESPRSQDHSGGLLFRVLSPLPLTAGRGSNRA